MKIAILLIFFGVLVFPAGAVTHNEFSAGGSDTLRSVSEVEAHRNSSAVIAGRLQKFTPWKEGKGRNVMYWNWEIVLPKGGSFPVAPLRGGHRDTVDLAKYENEFVIVDAFVFFGIVIGDSDPSRQSAAGYRLDVSGISIWQSGADFMMLPDTCRVYGDLEKNQNKEIIAAGKLIEYTPPHDASKLGSEKIWDWELQMQDGSTIPVGKTNSSLDLSKFKDKDVFIKGFLKYGIIFGDTNTANMEGYRIDPIDIAIIENETGYNSNENDRKITFDLGEFTEDGLRQRITGEGSSINYEFCIPAEEEKLNEVTAIDPTAKVYKGSKGRIGCKDNQWLVIGESRQSNFKKVIRTIAGLNYVVQINETFWE